MKLLLKISFIILTCFIKLNATPVFTKFALPSYEFAFSKTENVKEESVVKIGVQNFAKVSNKTVMLIGETTTSIKLVYKKTHTILANAKEDALYILKSGVYNMFSEVLDVLPKIKVKQGNAIVEADVFVVKNGNEIGLAVWNAIRKIEDFIPSSGTKLVGNVNKTTTNLGRWEPDMKIIKGKMLPNEFNVGTDFGTAGSNNGGFNFLNISDNLANSSADFFNQYNKPWLLQAIQRGDDIVLATRPINKNDFISATGQLKGMFAEELKFLVKQNHKPINLSSTEWNVIKTWFP